MRVENRMQKDLITITKGESIKTAIDLIRERRIRHLPVVEGKELVGILTERDVRPFYPAEVLGTKTPSSLLEIETSNRSGTLEEVCRIARDHNAEVISTYTTPPSRGGTERNLVVRLNIPHADHLVGELQKEGCKVLSCTTSG